MKIEDQSGNVYEVDVDGMTIVRHDARGEIFDLGDGDPCADVETLRAFVHQLHDYCDAYSAETRDALLAEAKELIAHDEAQQEMEV